ncbi:MAG: GGDEF domain-containing protein, partial [Nitrosomonadales bacterium]|nr:GGDEF domain-containing protein [Nitrosomonadales bacterium]
EPVVNAILKLVTDDVRTPVRDPELIADTMHKAKLLLDEARRLLTEMEQEEKRLLEIRVSSTETSQQDLNYKMLLMGGSFLLVLIYTFIKLFAEVAERKRSEAGLIETKALNEMTVHNLSLMGQLSSLLQACSKTEESLDVISQFAARMINVDSGALYLFKESRNLLEESAQWGLKQKSKPSFEPDDCWALRRGEVHVFDQLEHTMACRHVDSEAPIQTLCVPIIAQGTVLGILHLENHHHQSMTELQQTLAHNLASQIALALASLKLRETLRNLSVRDPLTGLFNRRYMEESLHREIATAKRKDRHLALVMLDVDHFKKFNDTFGHDAGDMLLREVGSLLQSNSRISDIACRFGGEEFVMIYPETEASFVLQRTEQLRQAISAMQVQHFGRSLGQITASFGIAVFPDHGSTIQELLKCADEALYRAKAEGRNRCVLAEKSSLIR